MLMLVKCTRSCVVAGSPAGGEGAAAGEPAASSSSNPRIAVLADGTGNLQHCNAAGLAAIQALQVKRLERVVRGTARSGTTDGHTTSVVKFDCRRGNAPIDSASCTQQYRSCETHLQLLAVRSTHCCLACANAQKSRPPDRHSQPQSIRASGQHQLLLQATKTVHNSVAGVPTIVFLRSFIPYQKT